MDKRCSTEPRVVRAVQDDAGWLGVLGVPRLVACGVRLCLAKRGSPRGRCDGNIRGSHFLAVMGT
ncbi:MAG: hypothetical protein R3C99_01635 [Pirellulaceae bacterium]